MRMIRFTNWPAALRMCALLLALNPCAVTADDVRISGVGLSAPLMERLGEAYRKREPGDKVHVVLPPLGSTGSMRALSHGKLDIAVIGRQPTLEEAGKTGQIFELARTAFGFATSDGKRPNGVSTADLADIYAGRRTSWDDGQAIRLIIRPERETDTQLVRQISAEVNAAMDDAAKRKGIVRSENDLDTLKLIETIPGSFGPTTTALVHLQASKVRLLAFNGVLPNTKTLAEGRYPLSKILFIALPEKPSVATERFVTFLQSPTAKKIMRDAEFVPSAR